MESMKNKNGFLVTCVSCIVLLLTLCYFGINASSKGTYSASDNCYISSSDNVEYCFDQTYLDDNGYFIDGVSSGGYACYFESTSYNDSYADEWKCDKVDDESYLCRTDLSNCGAVINNESKYYCSNGYTGPLLYNGEYKCYNDEIYDFDDGTCYVFYEDQYERADFEQAGWTCSVDWCSSMDTSKCLVNASYAGAETYNVYLLDGDNAYDRLSCTTTSGKCSFTIPELSSTISSTFNGWNTYKDGSGINYDGETIIIVDSDTTLYAQWTDVETTDEYTLTYVLNGGTMSGNTTFKYSDGTEITLPTPTRSDYDFNGWSLDMSAVTGGAAVVYDAGTVYTIKFDSTFTALWKAKDVTEVAGTISLEPKTATYNGSAIGANNATTNSDGIVLYQYFTDSSCSTLTSLTTGASITGAAPVDAGTYYVKATVQPTGNYTSATTDCIKHTINKKSVAVTWGSTSLTYTGSEQAPTASVSTGVSGETMTLTVSGKQTNVGSNYTATASCESVSGGRAKYSNYTLTNNSTTYSIVNNSSSDTVVAVPTANNYCKLGLVYNGKEQTLTNTAATGYSFSGNNGTDAGKYTVTATLADGYKWNDGTTTKTKMFECSIAKAEPTITLNPTSISVLVGKTSTFTVKSNVVGDFISTSGTVSIATLSSSNYDDVPANTAKTVTVNGVDKGTSTVTVIFVPNDTKNYIDTRKTLEVNVNKSGSTFTAEFNANGGTLTGGSTKECTTSGEATSCDITGLPTATKNGHTFNGWGTSSTCTSGDKSKLTLSANKTYYACYTKNASSGGNVTDNPQTGDIVIALVWFFGLAAVGYSFYYFKSLKQN